ncbi:unnamed protein product [Merluccius merluccius]
MMFRAMCLLSVLISLASSAVFVERSGAHQVLRLRRANSGFLEELKKGNIERECMEEICDYEAHESVVLWHYHFNYQC